VTGIGPLADRAADLKVDRRLPCPMCQSAQSVLPTADFIGCPFASDLTDPAGAAEACQRVASRWLARRGHIEVIAGHGREPLTAPTTPEKSTGEHLPIIALIAHRMKRDAARCLAAGWTALEAAGGMPPSVRPDQSSTNSFFHDSSSAAVVCSLFRRMKCSSTSASRLVRMKHR
jgi:hypothetical protein